MMLSSILCYHTVPPVFRIWGGLLDSSLKFDKQISAVVRSCFYHLLAKVKPFLSGKNFKTFMHAFLTS